MVTVADSTHVGAGVGARRAHAYYASRVKQSFTPAAQQIIDAARSEAARRDATFVGSQDFFLALYSSRTRAGGLLRSAMTSKMSNICDATLRAMLSIYKCPDAKCLSVASAPNGNGTDQVHRPLIDTVQPTIDRAKVLAGRGNNVTDLHLLNAAFSQGGCCATIPIGQFLNQHFNGVIPAIRRLF